MAAICNWRVTSSPHVAYLHTNTHAQVPSWPSDTFRRAAGEILPSWRFSSSLSWTCLSLRSPHEIHFIHHKSCHWQWLRLVWFPQQNRLSGVTISPRVNIKLRLAFLWARNVICEILYQMLAQSEVALSQLHAHCILSAFALRLQLLLEVVCFC
jgi:hypothetical protein